MSAYKAQCYFGKNKNCCSRLSAIICGCVGTPDAGGRGYKAQCLFGKNIKLLFAPLKRELEEKGQNIGFEEVLRDMAERDERDSTRTAAPLKAAADAVLLDTTELSLQESTDVLCRLIAGVVGL